jgi:hypothetical protein
MAVLHWEDFSPGRVEDCRSGAISGRLVERRPSGETT